MKNLFRYWVYGTLPAALLLLGLVPAVYPVGSMPLLLVYLQIPLYMLHQFEEHASDRFARFLQQTLGGGKTVITPEMIFWVNVPGVWGLNLLSFLLAFSLQLGLGLISIYLCLVNALTHLMACLVLKKPNPGLYTSLFLFLPVGGWSLWVLGCQPGVTPSFHLLGLGLALMIHVTLALYLLRAIRYRNQQTSRP